MGLRLGDTRVSGNLTYSVFEVFNVFDTIYPVGSIYLSTTDTCPIQDLGIGTWEKIAENINIDNQSSDLPVVGNGKTLGFTNGAANVGMISNAAGAATFWQGIYGQPYGTAYSGGSAPQATSLGVTTDASKSGLIAKYSSQSISVNIWKRIS